MRLALACLAALALHAVTCTVGDRQVGTQYDGIPSNVTIPAQLTISTMTGSGVNPTLITFTTPHNATSGDAFAIYNVDGNTAANGQWNNVTVTSATQISIPVTGNGTYTGSVPGIGRRLAFGATFQIPSDGDIVNASNNNVAPEALGDRTAYLISKTGALKLVSEGFLDQNDSTLSVAWATINSSVTAWTAATGASVPLLILGGLQQGDKVQLDLTFVTVNSSTGPSVSAISFGYAEQPPGAAVPAYAKVNGSGTALCTNSTMAEHSIVGEHGMSGANILYITVGQTITAAVTHINVLQGDFFFRYRVYRATGVNQ